MPSTAVVTSTAVQAAFPSPNPALSIHTVVATVLLADINAGYTIVPAVSGRTLRPVNFWIKCNGTFGALTAIILADTATSPVAIATIAQAQASDGAIFTRAGVSGLTIGAGFAVPLTASKGIQVYKTGSTGTTATSVDVIVEFIEV